MTAHRREHISVRGHIARLALRLFIKSGYRREPIEAARERFKRMEWLVPPPPRGTRTENLHIGDMPAAMITVREARLDYAVLFLHGGAYVVASFRNYGHFTWRIGRAARARVLAVDYRLAPEHPFPAALDDAAAAYRWMLDQGCKPERMLIAGDSAGGGLTLALMLKLRDEGAPLPAAAIALSPWTDLALTGASLQTNAVRDPMLVASEVPRFAQMYAGNADRQNPYLSPLYGDPRGLPPTLIQAGGDEILRDDATRMAETMKGAGCDVALQIWPGMPHVFQLLVPVLPEANAAVEEIGKFVQRVLP
jgi:monoterpene epsilon-lactone hydrolase